MHYSFLETSQPLALLAFLYVLELVLWCEASLIFCFLPFPFICVGGPHSRISSHLPPCFPAVSKMAIIPHSQFLEWPFGFCLILVDFVFHVICSLVITYNPIKLTTINVLIPELRLSWFSHSPQANLLCWLFLGDGFLFVLFILGVVILDRQCFFPG